MKTKHFILISGGLLLLSQGDSLKAHLRYQDTVRSEEVRVQREFRKERTSLRNDAKLSDIAIGRYQNNCILVVDRSTKSEINFVEGKRVLDNTATAQPLREGVSVCNTLGDTAKISAYGEMESIARVIVSDIPKMNELLEARKND